MLATFQVYTDRAKKQKEEYEKYIAALKACLPHKCPALPMHFSRWVVI